MRNKPLVTLLYKKWTLLKKFIFVVREQQHFTELPLLVLNKLKT